MSKVLPETAPDNTPTVQCTHWLYIHQHTAAENILLATVSDTLYILQPAKVWSFTRACGTASTEQR